MRAFESIMALQDEIENWKRWETNYSNMLSQNEGQRNQFEMQRNLAVFMQEIKHEKLHLMREELEKQEIELLSFMYPGCF